MAVKPTPKGKAPRKSRAVKQELPDLVHAIIRSIGAGIYIVQQGNFVYASPLFQELVGYAENELLGKYSLEHVYPDDRKVVRDMAIKSLKGENTGSYEYRFIRKSGEVIWVLELVNSIIYHGERAAIGSFMDITERKKMEQQLSFTATHDGLTGLPNRTLFTDRLTLALAHAQRSHHKLAVMMLDMDRFKSVNDMLGHDVGDQLLKAVGGRLTALLRKSDTVARMGGDEFVILLPEMAQADYVATVARKILDDFHQPFVFGGHELHITTSIGITVYPDDSEEATALLKNADVAMYRAKELGRNRYQLFSDI